LSRECSGLDLSPEHPRRRSLRRAALPDFGAGAKRDRVGGLASLAAVRTQKAVTEGETTMSTATRSRPMATGGLLFAATIMVLSGLFQFFQGIAGIAKDEIFVATPNYVFKFNTTAWGWINLVIGLIVAVTGFFVFTRAPWARGVAIAFVAFQAFTNFFFLPYYPFWALSIVALDIFVIWALAAAPGRAADDEPYAMGGDTPYEPTNRTDQTS
jgi:hypothetical protein